MQRFTSTMTPADLRAWINGHELTIGEAAEVLGVHERTVHGWLAGRQMPLMAEKLIEALAAVLAS